MAKIIIENTRPHDITLAALVKDSEVVQVTIPGAREDADDRNSLINGAAEADDSFVDAAKKSPVVAHYFDEGWLRVTSKSDKASKAAKE